MKASFFAKNLNFFCLSLILTALIPTFLLSPREEGYSYTGMLSVFKEYQRLSWQYHTHFTSFTAKKENKDFIEETLMKMKSERKRLYDHLRSIKRLFTAQVSRHEINRVTYYLTTLDTALKDLVSMRNPFIKPAK